MPFVFLIIGIVLVIAGVRDKSADLYTLIKGDFTGANNYLYWMVSILIIGAIGYIEVLKPVSRAFMVLVIIVLFISANKQGVGFFKQFQNALQTQVQNG